MVCIFILLFLAAIVSACLLLRKLATDFYREHPEFTPIRAVSDYEKIFH